MQTKAKKRRSVLVDDKTYWKARHSSTSNLKASGVKSVGVRSNQYIYKILVEQYLRLLNSLNLDDAKTVIDCGFGDGFFLKFYKINFPQIEISGVDISKDAKNKADFIPKNRLYTSDLTQFKTKKKFDIVHCFDVLYHVLSDEDYNKALINLAQLSKKYVILHEKFVSKSPLISSKHVYLRRAERTSQILNSQGLYLTKEIPTHFFALRLLTYKLNKIMPKTLYKLDNYIATKIHPSAQEYLASHHIRVYSKDQTT